MTEAKHHASFRDPSGFLFVRDGTLFRQINLSYAQDYDRLQQSGLYQNLVSADLLVAHEEVDTPGLTQDAYRVIQPERIPYVSYPYEWSFSQLKEAALLTLDLMERAIEHGMILKDASAFNVQFVGSRPVFIDSLSFEIYEEGAPWVAYRQFCQHFLAPLALGAHTDVRLQHLLKAYLDGLPLDLASVLLPWRTRFRYSLLAHIHLHAKSQAKYQDAASDGRKPKAPRMTKRMLEGLISSLRGAVNKLVLPNMKTEWGDYYSDTNYSSDAMAEKEKVVAELLDQHADRSRYVHDIGANTGRFSRLAMHFDYVVAHDVDPLAVERHYQTVRKAGVSNVLPLLLDMTNPAPGLGWGLSERMSFPERVSGGVVMALAVIHHLAISNNVPLREVSRAFADLAAELLIEFVPKTDSQVQRLLFTREDIFPEYSVDGFESAFANDFETLQKVPIEGSERILYFMRRRSR